MVSKAFRLPAWFFLTLSWPLLVGCHKANSVSGTVTYAGRDVEQGFITFFPMDDAGANVGGEIVNGKYQVANVPPGKKLVRISTLPRVQIEPGASGAAAKVKFLPAALPIPANAVGNGQIIDVAGGSPILDFHLDKPGSQRAAADRPR